MRKEWVQSNMDENSWVFSRTEETPRHGLKKPGTFSKNDMTCSLSIVPQLVKQVPTTVLRGATQRGYKGTALLACEKFKVKHLEERC